VPGTLNDLPFAAFDTRFRVESELERAAAWGRALAAQTASER